MTPDDLELARLKNDLSAEKKKSELEEIKSKLFEQAASATNEISKLKIELVQQTSSATNELGKLKTELVQQVANATDEFGKLKTELIKQVSGSTDTFSELKTELVQQVANAKVDIGKHAVDEMSKAFTFFRLSFAVAIALVFTLGGFSYVSIDSTVRKVVNAKLNDWLSFEKKGAILKDTLEHVREKMVLDSLVIRLARNKVEDRSNPSIEMSELEKSRLISYMQDPETDISDFQDAARLLAATHGMFSGRFADIKLDQMIRPIFLEKSFTNEKRLILLESLKNYVGVFDYSVKILNEKDAPTSWKIPSYYNVSIYNRQFATQYARQNLLIEANAEFQQQMAAILVNEKNTAPLNDWLEKHKQTDDGLMNYVRMADEISSQFSDFSSDATQKQKALKVAANLIFQSILHGANLSICERGLASNELCFKKNITSQSLQYPKHFFKDNNFLDEMKLLAKTAKFPTEQFVKSLTTTSQSGALFGIQVDLNGCSMNGAKFGKIDSDTAQGSIMLSHDISDNKIYASYRKSNGDWIRDEVTGYTNFYQTNMRFAFDENFMQTSTMRRYKQMDM